MNLSSMNLGIYSSKIIKLSTKIYRVSRNYSNIPLYNVQHIKSQCHKICLHNFTNNINQGLAFKLLSINYLKYCKLVELPPTKIDQIAVSASDVFGQLGGLKYEKVDLDEEELKEEQKHKYIGGKVPRKFKPRPGEYTKILKNHVSKGELALAEEVINLCIRNRDKPSPYLYSLIINAFALQGDIKKCYKYYSDMKLKNYKIKQNVYTSLFNVCANSPDSEKALRYLEKVRSHMEKSKVPLNHAHYNVLVKAYGRHNQFKKSEELVQYMINHKLKIGISTLNSLMYAANTDTASGLSHVFSIWQFMRHQRIPPDIFTYHLLLRAIRDTHFGNFTFQDLLNLNKNTQVSLNNSNLSDLLANPPIIGDFPFYSLKAISSKFDTSSVCPVFSSVNNNDFKPTTDSNFSESLLQNSPQMLPPTIANLHLDTILVQNKLILFGGFEEFLKKMEHDKLIPVPKTFSYLIELAPGSILAEEAVIKYANLYKVQLDIVFFNTLIKKRCTRGEKKAAKDVINYIHKASLKPNIVTYGVLALSCITPAECFEQLAAMKATGCVINKYIAKPFLQVGISKLDFLFILKLMELIKKERINVDNNIFELLDKFQQDMTALIKKKHQFSNTEKFKTGFAKFNMRYKSWQEDIGRKIVLERE